MATSLARQLERLAAPQSALVVHRKSRPSLLFDKREAALLDRDTVFSIGVDGFEDLLNLNPAFIKYQETLFSENAKTMERAVQTQDVNDKLDEMIEEFLCLLCPYFLLKPAQKALEWLIYRFHIQDFNVNALLRCVFPYHDTNIFVRALQLLQLREETNRWHWLHALQDPGVPLSKGALAARCAEDLGFMKFVCVMNKKLVKVHGAGSAALHAPLAFFTSALCSGLERCAAVTEPQVALLAPHLLRCLRSPLPELRAAGCMVTAQLARRAQLSGALTERLMTALAKSLSKPLVMECTAALAVVAQTQEPKVAPLEALQALAEHAEEMTDALSDLSQRCSVLPLVSCLLRTALLESAGGDATAAAMVTTLVVDVRMEVPREQEILIRCVSDVFTESDSAAAPLLAAVVPALAQLERQYPAPFQAVLAEPQQGQQQQTTTAHPRRLAALRAALRGHVGGAVGCGVFLDLNHPEESTRLQAVKQLMTSLKKEKVADRELVRSALVSALADESDRVARQALRVPVERCLYVVTADELLPLLTTCLDAGRSESTRWLCARALSRLGALADQSEQQPPSAALLTALFPEDWTEATVGEIVEVLQGPLCPELAAFLAGAPSCSYTEYVMAALEHIPARLSRLPADARRQTLVALASRLACGERPRPVRVAAAAIATACLRANGDGALQVLQQLQPILENGKLKVPDTLPSDIADSSLLTCGAVASLPSAVFCVLLAVIDAALDIDVSAIQWWCGAVASDDRLAALAALYKSAASGLSVPRSRSRPLHQNVVSALFTQRLESLPCQVAFLAQFWSAAAESGAAAADAGAVTAQVAALVMAAALLGAAPAARLTPLLAADAPLLPTLVVALQSPLTQVRTAAMECLQKISSVKAAKTKCPLLPLVSQLLTFESEIIADAGALELCLADGDRSWLPQLVDVIVSDAVPDHVRAALASLLPPLADQKTFRACLPVLSKLLDEASAAAAAAGAGGDGDGGNNGTTAGLSTSRSRLAASLLRLLCPDTAPCLSEPPVWEAVSAALALEAASLRLQDGPVSPQTLLLKQVTKPVFAALDGPTQSQLLTRLVDLCTDTQQSEVASRIHRVLRRVPLTTELLVHQLAGREDGALETPAKTVRQARTTRRRTATAAAAAATPTSTPAPAAAAAAAALPEDEASVECRLWRRRRVVLEAMQSRRKLEPPAPLLAALFALLRRLLRLEDQPAAEYIKQLGLTCVQQACERLQRSAEPPPADAAGWFSVETLVQCVRSSDSPQTHQLALIVLGMAAQMLPEMVLHNIMAVFTFMGSSMLRQDNEYSFRVIERTIESVVPALLQASSLVSGAGDPIVPVLRVFVDAVRDVPRHRRLPLFSHLLRTVGERRHLWVCLGMLADQLATRGDVKDKMSEGTVTVTGDRSPALLVEFGVSLCSEFPLDVQLESCSRLLEHTETLMERRHDPSGRAASSRAADDVPLFDLDAYADKQFYKHCHTAVGIIAQLLASEAFVAQSARLEDADTAAAAQAQHQRLLERAVRLITSCARLCQGALRGRDEDVRHVRAILHRLYALLDKVNALLPAAMFLSVISGLLASDLAVVRRRAMELLATRLQLQPDYFTEADADALLRLTAELVTAAEAVSDADAEAEEGSALNRQTALFALKLISRLLAGKHPTEFVPVLRSVCALAADSDLPAPLFASCLLCMAELCASLRAHAIARLPAIASALLTVLGDRERLSGLILEKSPPCIASALLTVLGDRERLSNELVLMSAVTLAHKLTESLPSFISPYLPELLAHVCRLSAAHAARGATSPLQHRLKQTRHQLAVAVPVRVLVPAVDQCFQRLASERAGAGGLGQLMSVLAEAETAAELPQLSAVLPELQALIIRGLEYRSSAAAPDAAVATAGDVERDVIGAVTSLVPRLSETTFRPFFIRLLDWASRTDAPPARVVTFYRLTDALAERLKGLFVLFAGHFVRHLATVLEGASSLAETPLLPDDESSSCELAEYALDTLCKVCSHDTEGFLNKERFHVLMQPLVDQLENAQGSEERQQQRLKQHLVPCLVSFLAAAGDDSLWKPANYQLLLKMRHQSPQVRLAAVAALSAVHSRLGDDYMTLLPETMPFLAELLEDEEPRVEAATQTLIKEMEETLGESLQKYF